MTVCEATDQFSSGLPYTGEAPFGSCFQQATANVAHLLGLARAEWSPGLGLGASWRGIGPKLEGGRRWINNLGEASGLRLRRILSPDWRTSCESERALLAAGVLPVAGVDSFYIPSPHYHTRHLMHAVIVVSHDADSVTFRDPMNEPHPITVTAERWERLRDADCVEGYEMIACEGNVRRELNAGAIATTLARDVMRHRDADAVALEQFVAWIGENGCTGLDVADVGAERLYAAELVSSAASEDPSLAPRAKTLSSLARRWYLLHTLALEASSSLSASRIVALLEDLAHREADVCRGLTAIADARVEGSVQ